MKTSRRCVSQASTEFHALWVESPIHAKTYLEEEKKKFAGPLAEKKLPTEGCTGKNGGQEKSSEQKKTLDDSIKIGYRSYAETYGKAEKGGSLENAFTAYHTGGQGFEPRNIKSRRLRWAEHVARMGESRNSYRVLVGRSEGTRPLGRPRRRWEDNIEMDLRDVGYDDRD
ncbi:hypothetical protein ANN_10399 [Periplaneta americana]|uniref:Uncharacterized protein n=1 Tax=Periplaneta americana TaxID=6978 RepID=A0ABQ8TRB0_PERAM|nr:hypothetical protein ANN_10399 [Periplaneta americana]